MIELYGQSCVDECVETSPSEVALGVIYTQKVNQLPDIPETLLLTVL